MEAQTEYLEIEVCIYATDIFYIILINKWSTLRTHYGKEISPAL